MSAEPVPNEGPTTIKEEEELALIEVGAESKRRTYIGLGRKRGRKKSLSAYGTKRKSDFGIDSRG